MSIGITNKGTAVDFNDFEPIQQITRSSVAIAQGASVIVGIVYNAAFGNITAASWNGTALAIDATLASGQIFGAILSLHGATAGTGQIVVSFQNAVQSAGIALNVIEATGLLSAGAKDKVASASGSGTAPSSGATAVTSLPDELLFGVVGMEYPGSLGGTWDASFSPLDEAQSSNSGTDDASLSTGYRIVSATGAYTASKTGTVNAPWGALIATYEGNIATHDAAANLVGSALLAANGEAPMAQASLLATCTLQPSSTAVYAAQSSMAGSAELAATVDLVPASEYRRRDAGSTDYRTRPIGPSPYSERPIGDTEYREREIPEVEEEGSS